MTIGPDPDERALDSLRGEATPPRKALELYAHVLAAEHVWLAMHGSYHRGQIALIVRDSGAEPQPTDSVAFVRGAPAATRTRLGHE